MNLESQAVKGQDVIDMHTGEVVGHLGPHPGDKCDRCGRRVPHPKKATSPQSRVFAYRVPIDDAETHGEILDAAAEELGILAEPHHRFKLALYGAMLILQGARLEETGG